MDYEELGLGIIATLVIVAIIGVPLWLETSDTSSLKIPGTTPVESGKSSTWVESAYNISSYGDRSDVVIEGTVDSVSEARREGPNIYRTASINVNRVLKGHQEADQVNVRMQGGSIGDTQQVVEDSASYSEGEHVLAFLVSENGTYHTLNMKHGKFRLEDGKAIRTDLPEEHRVYDLENLLEKTGLKQ